MPDDAGHAGEVNATTLASMLNISKGRVSQLVAEGRLEGSYHGEGRARRFDPLKAAELLDVRLDPSQAMGNGLAASAARRDLRGGDASPRLLRPVASALPPGSAPDVDNYIDQHKRAVAESAVIKAHRDRIALEAEEKRWVLRAEIERETRAAFASEIAVVESMLRDAARAVADRLAVDYREAKAILMEEWRRHRSRRHDDLGEQALAAVPSAAEAEQDTGPQA